MLALQKQGRKIKLSTGDSISILLDKSKPEPNRTDFMQKKSVVKLDWKTINFSYVALVDAFDPKDPKYDGVEAWITDLPVWVKELAQFLSDKYTENRSTEKFRVKISLWELKGKIDKFYQRWKTDDYKQRYNIFIRNWWDESIINNIL